MEAPKSYVIKPISEVPQGQTIGIIPLKGKILNVIKKTEQPDNNLKELKNILDNDRYDSVVLLGDDDIISEIEESIRDITKFKTVKKEKGKITME